MFKKFQEKPISSDRYRDIIQEHQLLRKQGVCERIFLLQKDFYRYPTSIVTAVKRVLGHAD